MKHEQYNPTNNSEKVDRKQVAQDIFNFFVEATDAEAHEDVPEILTEPTKILENMQNLDFKRFYKLIDNINAKALDIPVDHKDQKADQATFGPENIGREHIKFPSYEQNKMIWKDAFKAIKNKLDSEDISNRATETVALTIFNLIGDTHIYKDGNGRTARALYFMLSPKVEKSPDKLEEKFTSVVSRAERNEQIGNTRQVDRLFQNLSYSLMLADRGLTPSRNKKKHAFYCEIDIPSPSFEDNRVKFLALYDLLTSSTENDLNSYMENIASSGLDSDRREYLKPFVDDKKQVEDMKTLQVSYQTWSNIKKNEELFEELKKEAENIREEYVRKILEISMRDDLQDTKFGESVYEKLDQAFNV